MFSVLHFFSNGQSSFFYTCTAVHDSCLNKSISCVIWYFPHSVCNNSKNSEKCRSNSWRNSFAKFVKTATIRRVKPYDVTVALFFLHDSCSIAGMTSLSYCNHCFQACSYFAVDLSITSLFDKILDNLSLIILRNRLIICGGWMELLFTYNSGSLGFYRVYMCHYLD